MRGLDGRVDRRFAPGFEVARELDDQDRVFRGQADRGQQTHLEVDVVFQMKRGRRRERAQDSERHHHDHRDRHAPALVQRGQAQEHDQDRQSVQYGRLRSRLLLL